MKPRITLVTISVSFIPTLNASSVARPIPVPVEDVDDERLLGADPAGRDRDERGEALGHLDEQHVPDRLLDPERVEEEPDRDEAKHPVARLPERDLAQVARPVAQHGEALARRAA